jgi:glycine/sarcosine/betaine reductase complex component A
VYHVIEEAVKTQVAPEVYEEHIALMEMVLEAGDIAQAVQEVRAQTGQSD